LRFHARRENVHQRPSSGDLLVASGRTDKNDREDSKYWTTPAVGAAFNVPQRPFRAREAYSFPGAKELDGTTEEHQGSTPVSVDTILPRQDTRKLH